MKRIVLAWCVVSSVLLCAVSQAATRPHYGGTLRISLHGAPVALDPAASQPDSLAAANLLQLLFDTLVVMDASGQLQPALATNWQQGSRVEGNERWEFRVRNGVKFQDGSPLGAGAVAGSLRSVNPEWTISVEGDRVVIQRKPSPVSLLSELAMMRNAIAIRDSTNQAIGTGPFRVADWQSGRKLRLVANEEYWNGRPFVDAVEIELGRSLSDQFIALDLGRADVADLAIGRDRRVQPEGRRVIRSSPVELMAIVFARAPNTPDEAKAREALALSLDRAMIKTVLLQGEGEPTASLLPNWMTGYGSAFPSEADPAKAKALKSEVRKLPSWTLGYSAGDALARVVADRIVLNALDAGLNMKLATGAAYDAKLVRLTPGPADPAAALISAAAALGLPQPTIKSGIAEDLYAAETEVLRTHRVIPLFHLPASYGVNRNVNNFAVREDGTWSLESVWITGDPR